MKTPSFLKRLLIWRLKKIHARPYLMILSLMVGISSGAVAVFLFNIVTMIQKFLKMGLNREHFNYLYLIYPVIGISLVLFFARFILRQQLGHGIPYVLKAISTNQSYIKAHNMFSSVISSALTVGFGGSVGLEGPSVSTGAAIASNIGSTFRLSFKHKTLLIGCGAAAAMAAIFKAPIAGIVFAFEVIMLDLSTLSIIPILIASSSATITSYIFLGQDVIYPIDLKRHFIMNELPYYITLGVFTGLISVYFSRVYLYIAHLFSNIKYKFIRLLLGGSVLGALILIFPSLYGDGYESVNNALHGDFNHLFENSFFYDYRESVFVSILLLSGIVLLKVIASSATFGAGGIGGIFAPSLFIGANSGLLFVTVVKQLGLGDISKGNFALAGMAGLLAGVLHAPLTGLFLIAEITGGYALFLPLIITVTLAYATVKFFDSNSIYTTELAKKKELLTHHADKNAMVMMKVSNLIETNFKTVDKDATLGDLVKVIADSVRNIFPVVDENNYFIGVVNLDDIRQVIFQQEMYDKISVNELMTVPSTHVTPDDSMEEVAEKIQQTGRFNIVVLKDGKYLGFISRANVFVNYRKILKNISAE